MSHLKRHLNPATVISCIALFVALGGAAYAVSPLGNKAVKTKNLANGSVNTLKLRSGAVTTLKIRNGAVTGPKIAPGAVGATQIANGAVRSAALGGGVVTEGKLKNGAVTETKLFNSAVTNSKIGPNAVATGKIADGAVTSAKLAPTFLGQLVKNVSYVTKSSESNANELKIVVVECPTGKQVISGGGVIHGFISPNVAITESAPVPVNADNKRTSWTVTARAFKVEPEEWSVEAHAICAEF